MINPEPIIPGGDLSECWPVAHGDSTRLPGSGGWDAVTIMIKDCDKAHDYIIVIGHCDSGH
jgi:hypothetical protein